MIAKAALTLVRQAAAVMVKKLLLVALVVLGVVYGAGTDLASLKRSIHSLSNENARGLTAGDNGGWGSNSGY